MASAEAPSHETVHEQETTSQTNEDSSDDASDDQSDDDPSKVSAHVIRFDSTTCVSSEYDTVCGKILEGEILAEWYRIRQIFLANIYK